MKSVRLDGSGQAHSLQADSSTCVLCRMHRTLGVGVRYPGLLGGRSNISANASPFLRVKRIFLFCAPTKPTRESPK